MSRDLQKFGPGDLMKPFAQDLPGRVSPLWADGRNVLIDAGNIQPIPGQKVFINPSVSGPVRGISTMRVDETETVFWGTLDKLFRWTPAAGVVQEGTGYTLNEHAAGNTSASFWSIKRWADWAAATNGVNQTQIWKGPSTDFVNLSGPNFTWAKLLMPRTPHMVALHTSNGDHVAEWCMEGNIEDWSTGSGKSGGLLAFRDLPGPIIGAAMLSGEIVFYTPTSQHILFYSGAPYWFGERMLQPGFGVCSQQGVVAVGPRHFGMDTQRCWVSDGSNWQSISEHQNKDYIYKNFNEAQASKVVVQHMPLKHQIIFNFPSKNALDNDRALPWNYLENIWGAEITQERSAADQTPGSTFTLSGNTLGYIFDWSDHEVPASPSSPGILPVYATVEYELGWKRGGWKQFWWRGNSGELVG